jgi:hypothetical protein
VTVWGSASYQAERVDLFTCADPSASTPTWVYRTTVRPSREGAQVLFADVPVVAGAQAIRAHMLRDDGVDPRPVAACGTSASSAGMDDQDDLVFTAAP